MKVAKFGGSSVACAKQIQKVIDIIKNDSQIKYIVVSAPGKEFDDDMKVTDLLIMLTNLIDQDYQDVFQAIIARFKKIINDLALADFLIDFLISDLQQRINDKKIDNIKAFGENACALIITEALNKQNILASYKSPKDIGLYLTNERIVDEVSYFNIYHALINEPNLVVIPGFFGLDANQEIITFGRGGSDVTGAIVAASLNASMYENFTDVDNLFLANPRIIRHPKSIYEVTYREMRELAYAGFSVLHEETLYPLYRKEIPIKIRNTNNPGSKGTMICNRYHGKPNYITGITGKKGFTSIYIRKFLMNKEIGFLRRLLQIFEDEHISIEHAPTGIDHITIIVESEILYQKDYKNILSRIKNELDVDSILICDKLAILVVVGEDIISKNILSQSSQTLEEHQINVLYSSLAQYGVSLILGVYESKLTFAIELLYNKFIH